MSTSYSPLTYAHWDLNLEELAVDTGARHFADRWANRLDAMVLDSKLDIELLARGLSMKLHEFMAWRNCGYNPISPRQLFMLARACNFGIDIEFYDLAPQEEADHE